MKKLKLSVETGQVQVQDRDGGVGRQVEMGFDQIVPLEHVERQVAVPQPDLAAAAEEGQPFLALLQRGPGLLPGGDVHVDVEQLHGSVGAFVDNVTSLFHPLQSPGVLADNAELAGEPLAGCQRRCHRCAVAVYIVRVDIANPLSD